MRLSAIPQFLHDQYETLSIPGPISLSPFTFGRRMSEDPLAYMEGLMRTYGDVVRLPFPLRPIIQVTDPDLIGKVLLQTGKSNHKSLGYRRIKPLLGDGLLTSDGALWKQQRRLANPAFHQKVLNTFFTMIQAETSKMADEWEQRIKADPTIDVTREMAKLVFTVIVKALFSMDLSHKADQVKEALAVLQSYMGYLFYSLVPLPLSVPNLQNLRIKRAMNTINTMVYEIIDEHRRHPEKYQDLLSIYIQAADEESGARMSDELLRDEVVTLMLAGHETTAFTLSIALDQLARRADLTARIEAETAALPALSAWTPEVLKNMSSSGLVFAETLRMYPAAWSIGRELSEPLSYKHYTLPAGATLILVQYLTHRNPRYWENPEELVPERFQPENTAQRHPFAYFPFGGGQRTCIGSHLAKIEAQLIMSLLLQRFRMEVVDGHQYRMHPRISMILDPGVKLKVFKK